MAWLKPAQTKGDNCFYLEQVTQVVLYSGHKIVVVIAAVVVISVLSSW